MDLYLIHSPDTTPSSLPRPALLHNNSLAVVFGLALTQIIDVDERNQVLTTHCWLSLTWQDCHLKWNSSHHQVRI